MGYETLLFSLSFLIVTLGAFVLFSIYRQWRWGANTAGLFSGPFAPTDSSVDAVALQKQLNATRSAALSQVAEDEDEEPEDEDEELLADGTGKSFGFTPVYDEEQQEG